MKNKKRDLKINTIIYQGKSGEIKFRGDFGGETVWGTQKQIADVFEVDRTVVTKHIRNIIKDGEVEEKVVSANFAHTTQHGAIEGKTQTKNVKFYNLDIILAVGYRTNSAQAIVFRKWATKILKQYLVKGYALNQKRIEKVQKNFEELQKTISFLQDKSQKKNLKDQSQEILFLLNNYSRSLTLLDQFDKAEFKEVRVRKDKFVLNYEKAREVLDRVKSELMKKDEATDLFSSERGENFKGIFGNLYQTFDGKNLYKNIGEKAAHLLYFIIKDHPFTDGNKRSASFLFVYFLDKNNYLYKKSGEKKINDNALTALTLLVAESDPKEKDLMIKLIINLIAG